MRHRALDGPDSRNPLFIIDVSLPKLRTAARNPSNIAVEWAWKQLHISTPHSHVFSSFSRLPDVGGLGSWRYKFVSIIGVGVDWASTIPCGNCTYSTYVQYVRNVLL